MDVMTVSSYGEVDVRASSVTEPFETTGIVFLFVKRGSIRVETASGAVEVAAPSLIRWDPGERVAYAGDDFTEVLIRV